MKNFFDKLYKGTKKDFFVELQRRLDGGEKTFIVTANPEAFMYGEKDNIVRKLLLDKSTTVVGISGTGKSDRICRTYAEQPERFSESEKDLSCI